MADKHLPYVYAAWKKGALDWIEARDIEEFKAGFLDFVLSRYAEGWTLYGPSLRGRKEPVGLGLAWRRGRVVEVADFVWFPWASARNKVETVTHLLDVLRKADHDEGKVMVLVFSGQDDKRFYDHVCRHGVLRRIGTTHNFYPGSRGGVYETVEING